ncbi:MAG: hypothetical protein ACK5HT_10985, partial [Draconibacterium sp.]
MSNRKTPQNLLPSIATWVVVAILPLIGIGKGKDNKKIDYYVAAYIWPSCHHVERFGNMLWPEGTGEWEVIKKGNPR